MKRLLLILTIISIILSIGCTGKQIIQMENEQPPAVEDNYNATLDSIDEPNIENISLLAVGDIMFHHPQMKGAYLGNDSYDFTPNFKYIKEYIENADIALANFETVTAGKEKGYSGFPRFNSPKDTIVALKDVGFDILSTANNHSLDQGKGGLISTIEDIHEYGLKNIGTHINENEGILIEDIKGIKIGFLSYTYGLNGLDSLLSAKELSYMVDLIDEEIIEADIQKTKELGVDLTVVYIHWGYEYHSKPATYQIELGKKMVEWGANIILGSHPHVIQRAEIVEFQGRDNFIIYSMGNLLSNQREETMGNSYTEDGVMIKLNIEKDMDSNKTIIKEVEFIPTWIYRYEEKNKIFHDILPIEDIFRGKFNIILPDNILKRMEKSLEDTRNTLQEK